MDTLEDLVGLVRGIRHDLCSPLNAIKSFAGFMSEDYGEGPVFEYLQKTQGATNRLIGILNDFKEFGPQAQDLLAPLSENLVAFDDLVDAQMACWDCVDNLGFTDSNAAKPLTKKDYFSLLAENKDSLLDPIKKLGELSHKLSNHPYLEKKDRNLLVKQFEAATYFTNLVEGVLSVKDFHPAVAADSPPEIMQCGELGPLFNDSKELYKQLAFTIFGLGTSPEYFDVQAHVMLYKREFSKRGIDLRPNPSLGRLKTDDYLGRVISNILGNAAVHAEECTKIDVCAHLEDGYCVVSILNNGVKGLNPNEIYGRAVEMGIIEAGTELSIAEKFNLITHSGYTSSDLSEDQVAYGLAAGLGMSIVAKRMNEVGGFVEVASPVDEDHIVGFYLGIPLDKIHRWDTISE